jgi:hypothetical protein
MLKKCNADNIKVCVYINHLVAWDLNLVLPDWLANSSTKKTVKKPKPAMVEDKDHLVTNRKTLLFDRTLYKAAVDCCIDRGLKVYQYLNKLVAKDTESQFPKKLAHFGLVGVRQSPLAKGRGLGSDS